MPYSVRDFQSTPNPNAVKCLLDRVIRSRDRGPASYRNAAAAADDPIAATLFAISGVTTLLINEDWITVNKDPKADWKAIKPAVTRALAASE